MNSEDFQSWVGRQETRQDDLNPWAARSLHMTLDRNDPLPEIGSPLPLAWHWVYFLDTVPIRELGRDGHPAKGGFLPPIPLPRRMWAGGRFNFESPLILGTPASRSSTILSITEKTGRSGQLCFVTVEHKFSQQDHHCFTEEHNIVYREDPASEQNSRPPLLSQENADWQQTLTPSPTLLFRYSALTFNGHRIHYDRDYARDVEGYPGLVVHGPLIATVLFELLRDHTPSIPASLHYRAIAPLFANEPISVNGRRDGDEISLWACGADDRLAMTATALV